MSRTTWIVLGIGLAVILGVAAVVNSGGASGGLVSSARFQSAIADGARIVDVRTAAEFESGHIPGAVNVPVNELEAAAAGWNKSEPLALYCATGSRSAEAAAALRSMGFETVYDLSGGIVAWEGDVEGGAAVAAATAQPSASGLPIMYEFYTDW